MKFLWCEVQSRDAKIRSLDVKRKRLLQEYKRQSSALKLEYRKQNLYFLTCHLLSKFMS